MKKTFKNPIVITTIGTVLGTIIATGLVSIISSISIFSALKTVYNFIVNLVIAVLTFNVPVYIIISLIALFILLLMFINKTNNKDSKDSFLNYKEDVIDDIRWVWDWIKIYDGYEFKSNTPIPLCNHCKGNLVIEYIDFDYYLHCENCNFKKRASEGYTTYQSKIKREIHRKVRVKYDL